ncbi:MAG: protein translocase subunit SecF [Patescibacteria group bacterium]|jgi:preprotein translocase subunit SecF
MSKTIQVLKYKWLWFGLSAVLIIPGIIFMSVYGVKVGIDFKSGTSIEYTAKSAVTADAVKQAVSKIDLKNLSVTTTGNNGFILKTDALSDEQHSQITDAINKSIPDTVEKSYTSVGPTIGKDQTNKAVWRVIIASLAIILYIAWAFRKVPKPANSWRFGICAVVALLHDLIFVIGMFAILGRYYDFVELDSLTVTALLTIMGFSVHDTIVVFDRIRENLRLTPGGNFEHVANVSISQTLARSLNTSLTVLIVLLALFLLGGESTKGFVLALLIGITVGTYSSIFNATPLLVVWQNRSQKH